MDAHERYDATGAVQAQVLALLNDYGEGDFTTTIAQRSPLGPAGSRGSGPPRSAARTSRAGSPASRAWTR